MFLAALIALAFAFVPSGPDVSGAARVVDGDTLWIGDTKIRLFGVNAPEASDPLGPTATRWLDQKTRGKVLDCYRKDTDRFGRMAAMCEADGIDLSAELARQGMAKAYRRFSLDYVDEEDLARLAGIGVWNQDLIQASGTEDLPDCPIKGNISSSGKIYHLPGSNVYPNVRINTSNGERWFCSEEEARAAGWRSVYD